VYWNGGYCCYDELPSLHDGSHDHGESILECHGSKEQHLFQVGEEMGASAMQPPRTHRKGPATLAMVTLGMIVESFKDITDGDFRQQDPPFLK